MKKLKLDLDTVRVESFVIDGASGRGTVRANSPGPASSDCSLHPPQTCLGNTCWDSCGGSCDSLCC